MTRSHLICGCVTISMSPVPARLRSTSTSLPTVWLLAVSWRQWVPNVKVTHLLNLELDDADIKRALHTTFARLEAHHAVARNGVWC